MTNTWRRLAGVWRYAALGLTVATTPVSAASLDEIAGGLNLDGTQISVSGISSGAYMAQQLHVIHSGHIRGAGIIAGGPYMCAAGTYFGSWFDFTGVYEAMSICSNTNPYWFFQGPPDVEFSIEQTVAAGAQDLIDDPVNLRQSKVWLFAGERDVEIPTAVMDTLEIYYQHFVDITNIKYEKHPDANHAMITDDFGNSCDALGPPYINDCDFDAAGELLRHIYGSLNPKTPREELAPVLAFDQDAFFDSSDASVSMNNEGHIYVPAGCARGAPCRLHIAFHGCQQFSANIGDDFYSEAGYNEWAEGNDIVVLYPQTRPWDDSLFFSHRQNPKGCWDWWGYSGDDYGEKSGKQIRAIAAMVNRLHGEPLWLPAFEN